MIGQGGKEVPRPHTGLAAYATAKSYIRKQRGLLPAPGMLGLGIVPTPSCGFIATPGGRSPRGVPGGGHAFMPPGVKPIGGWPGSGGGPGTGTDAGPEGGAGG